MARTLPSENTAWGFHGTIAHATDPDPAWRCAFTAIAAAADAEPEAVRAFLDGRDGRHFADDVASELNGGSDLAEAVEAVTLRWLAWTISRQTERETGIPAGLPYLVGHVIDASLAAEA